MLLKYICGSLAEELVLQLKGSKYKQIYTSILKGTHRHTVLYWTMTDALITLLSAHTPDCLTAEVQLRHFDTEI